MAEISVYDSDGKDNAMTLEKLMEFTTLYEIAKILELSPPSAYKWKASGKIPPLRLYQLKEKRPEWFAEQAKQ